MHPALQLIVEARRELQSKWIVTPWFDPDYEREVAETPVPKEFGELSRILHAAHEALLNEFEPIR